MNFKVRSGVVEIKAPDSTARLTRIEGTIEFDPDDTEIAHGELTIDMRGLEAGDDYQKWKLAADLDAANHATATVKLVRFDDIHEELAGRYRATATVYIEWRGASTQLRLKGRATVDRRGVDASATGELTLADLEVSPPRFLLPAGTTKVGFHVSLQAYAIES